MRSTVVKASRLILMLILCLSFSLILTLALSTGSGFRSSEKSAGSAAALIDDGESATGWQPSAGLASGAYVGGRLGSDAAVKAVRLESSVSGAVLLEESYDALSWHVVGMTPDAMRSNCLVLFEQHSCLIGLWGSWGTCSRQCAGGVQKRLRTVEGPSNKCGEQTESRRCNTGRCVKPCRMSPWQSWGGCIKDGVCGMQRRSRAVIDSGDVGCGSLAEARVCGPSSCMMDKRNNATMRVPPIRASNNVVSLDDAEQFN